MKSNPSTAESDDSLGRGAPVTRRVVDIARNREGDLSAMGR